MRDRRLESDILLHFTFFSSRLRIAYCIRRFPIERFPYGKQRSRICPPDTGTNILSCNHNETISMDLSVNRFNIGMITGAVVGWTLNKIKNVFSKNKDPKVDDKKRRVRAGEEYKMALLVRDDLKMGKGKVAAQCSHATVHCYEEGLKLHPEKISEWESNNKLVNVFKVANERLMMKYQELAEECGYYTYIVVDAGRTQVAPHTQTVLAIGPEMSVKIDLLTGSLEVYN